MLFVKKIFIKNWINCKLIRKQPYNDLIEYKNKLTNKTYLELGMTAALGIPVVPDVYIYRRVSLYWGLSATIGYSGGCLYISAPRSTTPGAHSPYSWKSFSSEESSSLTSAIAKKYKIKFFKFVNISSY